MNIGLLLSKKLAEKEITQNQLAKEMEIYPSQISEWITGKVIPSMKNLYKISKILGVDIEYFLSESKESINIESDIPEELLDKFPSIRKGILVPLLGEVSAGEMKLAIENPNKWEDAVYVPGYVMEKIRIIGDHLFALTIASDSMTGIGINKGDLAICEWLPYNRYEEYRSGDIVIAEYDGKVTIKRLFTERFGFDKVMIILEPANPKYRPIIIKDVTNQFHPLGKLKTIIRTNI